MFQQDADATASQQTFKYAIFLWRNLAHDASLIIFSAESLLFGSTSQHLESGS